MINILTHPPGIFSLERLKSLLRQLLGKERGPAAVLLSLERGLDQINTPFQLNPPRKNMKPDDIVHVLSGPGALRYALNLKRSGEIRRLIAGPNISVLPKDHHGILLEKEIDVILQPSEWTKNLYMFLEPSLEGKVRVWAAGVEDPGLPASHTKKDVVLKHQVLIFQKNAPSEILEGTKNALTQKGFTYQVIEYGKFKKGDYFKMLTESRFMVYLSKSESQGLALNQAWIRDVPTLVWDRGYFEYGEQKKFEAKNISAPYLMSELGLSFSGPADLEENLETFLSKLESFSPRKYSLEHFTEKIAAMAYLHEIM